MARTPIVILNSGGLRSLIATAATVAAPDRPLVTLLHVLDNRTNTKSRSLYAHSQAEHFNINQVLELELPRFKTTPNTTPDDATPGSPLMRSQILIVALARAVAIGANRLIWPTQANGDFNTATRMTEQALIAQHMAKLEHPFTPAIETPLLEMSDKQLIELGGQMDVPWQLAWSCQIQGEKPCRVCPSCRRREAAFEAAGMTDPSAQPIANR